jgi:hypothetical protein
VANVTISTIPITVNATAFKGYTARMTIPYTIADGSLSLTSSTALLTIKNPAGSGDVTDAGTPGGIFAWTVGSASSATATLEIDDTTTAAWNAGAHCWKIEVTLADGSKHLFMDGTIIVTVKGC